MNTSAIPDHVLAVLPGTRYHYAVAYEQGCPIDGDPAKAGTKASIAAAARAAAGADLAVVVVGLDRTLEYEMRDRDTLLLPKVQSALVAAVATAAGEAAVPVVVVVYGGGVVDVSDMLANPVGHII